jgi:hypothetical protein
MSTPSGHEHHLAVNRGIGLLAAVVLAATGIFFLSIGSTAGAATPAKTVCRNAIKSNRTLTNTQMKACQKAGIRVPKKQQPTTFPAQSTYLGGNANPTYPAGRPGQLSVVYQAPISSSPNGTSVPIVFRNNTKAGVAHVDISATATDMTGKDRRLRLQSRNQSLRRPARPVGLCIHLLPVPAGGYEQTRRLLIQDLASDKELLQHRSHSGHASQSSRHGNHWRGAEHDRSQGHGSDLNPRLLLGLDRQSRQRTHRLHLGIKRPGSERH